MISITSTSSKCTLSLLLRYHQFILTRRRGSRDEIAAMLGVSKNKLNDLRRLLLNFGAKINYNAKNKYYEYLNDFEFYIGPAKPTGVGW